METLTQAQSLVQTNTDIKPIHKLLQDSNLRKSREFSTEVRVIYADTDKMGVVYHSRYLHYFEIGRNEMLREVGFTYKQLEENEIYLPIIELNLNYYKPAQYDDLLTIKSVFTKETGKSIQFKLFCAVYRGDELLTNGYTVHITTNSQGKVTRPNRHILKDLMGKLFED